MDESLSQRSPVPSWYLVAALAALLFEAFGCYSYLTDVTRSSEALAGLPLDQRMMVEAMPAWIYAAYAIAVWSGLAGAVGLIVRRRWAIPALGLSLLAILIQFGGIFLVPRLRQVTPPEAMVVPLAIIAIAAAIYWLAHHALRRGWLR